MVLNERLIDAIENFDLISQEQIGSLKGFMTTDHSFIRNSIVNKLVKESNKTTYLALVDLRKAYDRVDRKSLIYKLRQRGISGVCTKRTPKTKDLRSKTPIVQYAD